HVTGVQTCALPISGSPPENLFHGTGQPHPVRVSSARLFHPSLPGAVSGGQLCGTRFVSPYDPGGLCPDPVSVFPPRPKGHPAAGAAENPLDIPKKPLRPGHVVLVESAFGCLKRWGIVV